MARIDAADVISRAVSEASRRFRVPELWIRAVMRVESGGAVHAVSSAGAIGLMQVMPQTYAELRWRYGLGADPFDIRDNILAGAAYIRELADRYGAPAFLAAYNAGPARFDDAAGGVRALPSETLDYLARLGPIVSSSGDMWAKRSAPVITRSPLEAPIFVAAVSAPKTAETRAEDGLSPDRLLHLVEADATIVSVSKAAQVNAQDRLATSPFGLAPLFPSRSGPTR